MAAAHHASPSYITPIDANPDDIERECNQQHEGECDQSLHFGFRIGISISLLLVASAVFLLTVSWALPISFALTIVAAILGIVALCRPGYCCSRSQRCEYSRSSRKTLAVTVVCSSICILLHLIFILRVVVANEPEQFPGSPEYLCLVILTPFATVMSMLFTCHCAMERRRRLSNAI